MSCCNIRMILFVYLTLKNLPLLCQHSFYFSNFTCTAVLHMHFLYMYIGTCILQVSIVCCTCSLMYETCINSCILNGQ